jgi:hypothetical protein
MLLGIKVGNSSGNIPYPEYDLKVLRKIVTKVALRMLNEQQD